MGNVPSALKHCLSYQHLLKEQLWIGEGAAPQPPGQVPERLVAAGLAWRACVKGKGRRGRRRPARPVTWREANG